MKPAIRYGLRDRARLQAKTYSDLAEAKREAMGFLRSHPGERKLEVIEICNWLPFGGLRPIWVLTRKSSKPRTLSWMQVNAGN
jgi:hypothetical protein